MKSEDLNKKISPTSKLRHYSIRYSLFSFGVFFAILATMVALIYLRTIAADNLTGGSKVFTDFDAFYLAGNLYWSGNLIQAYDSKYFFEQMAKAAGQEIFMPWTYPPFFNILTATLAIFPRAISYVVFMTSGMILFVYLIYRISHDLIAIPFLLVAPVTLSVIGGGQNSFITGSLLALFCLAVLLKNKSPIAGVPLGLMVIKPHLAIGLGWMLLLQKRWIIVFLTASVIIFTSLLSTWMFGISIWSAFTLALDESSNFLKNGQYPMDRMVSVYALTLTMTDGSYSKAILAHILFLAIPFGFVWVAIARNWNISRVLAISCIATLTASPYCYDYDTLIAAVAFALVAGDLIEFSSLLEKLLLVALSWLMSGWGVISILWLREWSFFDGNVYSMAGVGLAGVVVLLFKILLCAEKKTGKVLISQSANGF